MTLTLTATEKTKLQALHGPNTLKRATNPEAAATAIDWDVAAVGVEAAIAAFARRGYSLGQDDIEVLYYSILWIQPRPTWSGELKDMNAEWEGKYPQRWAQAISSGSVSGEDVDDRKSFTETNLNKLDKIRRRPGHDQARGNL